MTIFYKTNVGTYSRIQELRVAMQYRDTFHHNKITKINCNFANPLLK